ncbi:hypothetical protein FHN55_20795 [Streptomyces sp. NP160]|nr:hypothetical protein FHN55_20795 [Streptomyces sp. NP160]
MGRLEGALEAMRAAAAQGRSVVAVVVSDDVDSPGRTVDALEARARGVALVRGFVAEVVAATSKVCVRLSMPPKRDNPCF